MSVTAGRVTPDPEDRGLRAATLRDAWQRRALEQLPCILTTASLLTNDRDIAEGLVIRAYAQELNRFRGRPPARLKTRLLEALVDAYRADSSIGSRRAASAATEWGVPGPGHRHDAERVELPAMARRLDSVTCRQLRAALSAMPVTLRLTVWLADREGLPHRDLEQIVRVPYEAIPSTLRTARVLLARLLTRGSGRPHRELLGLRDHA
jgi:DNA-directed RNA polymerase specialized sigma24 family protein